MAVFSCETKKLDNPKGKPRVYFTCHPEDFALYYSKIKEYIFYSHDCAIYYTQDMSEPIEKEDLDADLGQMNLFVVPVTFKLLSTKNRAMRVDIAYAKEKNIPILPFMMESGIDSLYSEQKNFGERQYLNPNSHDMSEIGYQTKLKKYLDSVLINSQTAKRVREAFDAYIFLSYRKKDRKYAKELMRLIHKNPEFRDIAIWYDEFLTPGENFSENIRSIMEQSEFLTLLVTPNLLEEPNGKPNFVMGEEYPAALQSNMTILPAEMVATDKTVLAAKFEGLPPCVDPRDHEGFRSDLLKALKNVTISANNEDPEHNYLIGLAYMEGIDVEVDQEIGLGLLRFAAERGHAEAMLKLVDLFYHDIQGEHGYQEAVYWAEKHFDYCCTEFGKEHPNTLSSAEILACAYRKTKNYSREIEIREWLCQTSIDLHGLKDLQTLNEIHQLSVAYVHANRLREAMLSTYSEHSMRCDVQGDTHPSTLNTLSYLASIVSKMGEHERALEFFQYVYDTRLDSLGEAHWQTRQALYDLALEYKEVGNWEKVKDLLEYAYTYEMQLGEDDKPHTIRILSELGGVHRRLGNRERFVALYRKILALQGVSGGFTLDGDVADIKNFYALSLACDTLGEHQAATKYMNKVQERISKLGESHPKVIEAYYRMSLIHHDRRESQQEEALKQKAMGLLKQAMEQGGPDLIPTALGLANACKFEDPQTAAELFEIGYTLQCKAWGDQYSEYDALDILVPWANACEKAQNGKKALELNQLIYSINLEYRGEKHPETLSAFCDQATCYAMIGNYQKAKEIYDTLCAMGYLPLTNDSIYVTYLLGKYADVCCKCEEYARETELRERIFALNEKYREQNEQRFTLKALNELIACYERDHAPEKLVVAYEKQYTLSGKVNGPEHPDTLKALGKLSSACAEAGDYSKAIEHRKCLLKIRASLPGETGEHLRFDLFVLAAYFGKLGEFEKMIEVLRHLYDVVAKLYGQDSRLLTVPLKNLVPAYVQTEQYQAALPFAQKWYSVQRSEFGEEHTDTITALDWLAYLYRKNADDASALDAYQKLYALQYKVLGEQHSDTLYSKKQIAELKAKLQGQS